MLSMFGIVLAYESKKVCRLQVFKNNLLVSSLCLDIHVGC
jgi:hypothetical protein